jgi:hypothetical protein
MDSGTESYDFWAEFVASQGGVLMRGVWLEFEKGRRERREVLGALSLWAAGLLRTGVSALRCPCYRVGAPLAFRGRVRRIR